MVTLAHAPETHQTGVTSKPVICRFNYIHTVECFLSMPTKALQEVLTQKRFELNYGKILIDKMY